MDRAANGLNSSGRPGLPPGFDAASDAPIDRATAIAAVVQADDLMERSEPEYALSLYSRATACSDRDVVAAGYYGVGNALYRMDHEAEAREAWQRATSFGETPVAYRAWRQVAAALVREGNVRGAIDAYRQCEKRAPREDRAEISSRLGWLNKETGNAGAANKYFARSRGDSLPPFLTYLIIAVTAVASISAFASPTLQSGLPAAGSLMEQLELDKLAIAHGELYRLLSVTLVHANYLHLFFNMYALWYAGQLVERMYGTWRFAAFYVICGIAGSVGTLVFGDAILGVGASGAIFGLFGVILVATRFHHTVLDARSRAISSQIGLLIVLNLVIGFSGMMNVDNFAHIGGLLAGMWLALIFPPGQMPILASLWHSPGGGVSRGQTMAVRLLGSAALVAVLGAGLVVGTSKWQASPYYPYIYGRVVGPAPAALISEQPSPEALLLLVK
ncbi:MAG TPA: rhomboid family intramembrane serine protease [Candidatus Limnocylindrales bacterium]